jgi:hypothetical protein
MDYVLHRRKKKTIITVFGEGGNTFFGYIVCRDGTEALRIEEEHRKGRLCPFLFRGDWIVYRLIIGQHGTCTQ